MTQNDALSIASIVKTLELKESELNQLNEDVETQRFEPSNHYSIDEGRMKAWLTSDVESLRTSISYYQFEKVVLDKP